MKSQRMYFLATLALSMLVFLTHTEAQQTRTAQGKRYYYSQQRPVYPQQRPIYTARPAATIQPTVRPASTTTRPVAATPVSASAPATATTPQTRAATVPSAIWSMLTRNNSIRSSRGMRPMTLSSRLTAAAQNHANYMARTGGFSHYSNGGPQGRAAMYGFRGGVRENIAMGQPTVDSAFNTWTASGGHYANMMSHSDVAGFGYAVGNNGQAYWVAVYGNNDGGN